MAVVAESHIFYLPAGRSVEWKTVTEVLKMLLNDAGHESFTESIDGRAENQSHCRIRDRALLEKKFKCNQFFQLKRDLTLTLTLWIISHTENYVGSRRLPKCHKNFFFVTFSDDNRSICIILNLSNSSFIAETATLDEIDLAFAISSAAAGAEATFQRIKDTVKEIMQTYKTDKLRYALLVFGSQPSSPISFALSLPDDETVG